MYEAIVPKDQHKKWPALVYVPSVATVKRVKKTLQEKFPNHKITSWTGDSTTSKRLQREIKAFQSGEIDILVLCEMGGRGLNLPRARCIIDAYPTLSANKLEQRHARALRKIRKGSIAYEQGFDKPDAHIVQILPKSNSFRPRTLMDLLDVWSNYKPGQVLLKGGAGGDGSGCPPLQEEVDEIVENMKKHPLHSKVTLLESVDVLHEIKLREDLPMADKDGFIYLDE